MATGKVYRNRGLFTVCDALAPGTVAMLMLMLSATVHASTITVNSLADTGAPGICVLRDAITAADTMTATNGCAAGTCGGMIQFSVTGTIALGRLDDSSLTDFDMAVGNVHHYHGSHRSHSHVYWTGEGSKRVRLLLPVSVKGTILLSQT
jgi:hypothetical protein